MPVITDFPTLKDRVEEKGECRTCRRESNRHWARRAAA